MIKNLLNDIYNLLQSITMTSINYVTWTSAVVVALLALTTIIFSQYNERQIIKSNDISRKIKEMVITGDTRNIIVEAKELIHVLSNQKVYKWTLTFFFAVSYMSGLLWLLSGIGYILLKDTTKKELSSGDLTIISLSLAIIVGTFFILPIILIQFNNKPPIKIDNTNRISFEAFSNYFKSINSISVDQLIIQYINPELEVTLNHSNKLTLALKQKIPIHNLYFVFKFNGVDNQSIIICIKNSNNEDYIEFSILPKNKIENSFKGLFNILKNSTNQHLLVFSKDKNLITSFKLTLCKIDDKLFSIKILNPFQLSADDSISKVLGSIIYKFQTFKNGEPQDQYRLSLKKNK